MKRGIYVILFLLLIDTVLGATVFGNVYDFGLDKQPNTIIEVNSTPKQIIVAKEGEYSFELPVGKYEIKAKYLVNNETYSSVIETIDIKTQGDFRLDLILFPNFELEEEILKEAELEVEDLEEKDYTVPIIFAVILGIGIILYLISKLIKSKEEIEADEAKKIIEFIKKHGSRITQKDIRKNFPSSEAKISLILTELEEKGIIKKIKRGRGNIIVLK